MKVWIAAEVAGGAMDCSYRAALAIGNSSIRLLFAIVGRHGVGEDAYDLAKQFSIERQREAQREWHGQDPMTERRFGQDVIHESQRARVHPPAAAARTKATTLT